MNTFILGDYNVVKQVGQGTLGAVYLAEHRFIKKHYLLKALPEELSSDRSFVQRFEEGVQQLASLQHPHIVRIHNVSFSQGTYFLVTDCIVDSIGEMTNLGQYIADRHQRLSENDLVTILRQIADALDYAHSRDSGIRDSGVKGSLKGPLVHLGLKLNNILISNEKSTLKVFLSDFGLTRIVGTGAFLSRVYKSVADALGIIPVIVNPATDEETYPSAPIDSAKLSKLHQAFLQSYHFLAPEQKLIDCQGSTDLKVDVYAFGVLAYFLITGEYPEGVFEMPSEVASQHQLNWDALVKACLQSNPKKRPGCLLQAMDELLHNVRSDRDVASVQVTKQVAAPLVAPLLAPSTPPLGARIPLSEVILPIQAPEPFIKPTVPFILKQPEPQQEKAEFKAELAMAGVAAPPRVMEESQITPSSPGFKMVVPPRLLTLPSDKPSIIMRSQDSIGVILPTIDNHVTQYQPEHREIRVIEPILTDMVTIKGGAFYRGSPNGNRDEMPRHRVVLEDFAMDIHPVTNEQFVRFLEILGGEKDAQHHDLIRLRESRIKRSSGKLSIESGYAKHPVVGVTWYGAVSYTKWVGKRLPTEAEWEIASCGVGENAMYATGEEIEKSQANFFSSDTTAVMSYVPTGYGLYDMVGNVYEWCQDWYSYTYYEVSAQEPDNPKGPVQGVYRVLRGGCWKSLKEDLRCSHRHRNNPGTVNGTYGFRCAAG